MAGVKSLLKAAANDMVQTTKAQAKPAEVKTEAVKPAEPAIDTPPKAEEPKKVSSKKQKEDPKPKNLGGRPTNKEKGIKSRKQYTLTLKEDTYKLILEKAGEEDLSFAKFMERAALEYIENHK